MSIIYDALQKTQAAREMPISAEVTGKASKRPWIKIILGILFAITCMAMLADFIAASQPKKSGARIIKPTTPFVYHALPALTLNGLFLSDDEVMAMINNHIVHVGDTIENLKVISITDEGVELKNNQHRLILKESIIKSS